MRYALPALAMLLLASSCALRPDERKSVSLSEEYRTERLRNRREPIILIPGTLGSRLHNVKTGQIAWGSFSATISELDDDLDLPIDGPRLTDNRDNVQAYRVLDLAEVLQGEGDGEVRFYAEIIETLTSTLGYRVAYGRRFYRGQDLFVFFYDWRRSNVDAAVQLGEFISGIRRDLGTPDMKFAFLGVSNGGLIARYYLKHGGRDVVSGQPVDAPISSTNAGHSDATRLITLCTPQTGTLDALKLMHEGYSPAPLARRHPPETIFSMPAGYELLPDPGQPCFVDATGKPLELDLWSAANWEKYGISVFCPGEKEKLHYRILAQFNDDRDREGIFNAEMERRRKHLTLCLTHAARFKRAISGIPSVPMVAICGVNIPTLHRVAVVQDGDEWDFVFEPRFTWRKSEPVVGAMFGMGDGVVTRRSALGEYLPESPPNLRAQGQALRSSLQSVHLTPCRHREMFDEPLLKAALIEELTR